MLRIRTGVETGYFLTPGRQPGWQAGRPSRRPLLSAPCFALPPLSVISSLEGEDCSAESRTAENKHKAGRGGAAAVAYPLPASWQSGAGHSSRGS